MPSRFIHAVANGKISFFLWLSNIPLYTCITAFPPTVHKCFPFSTCTPTLVICGITDDGHSDRCEVVSHCAFDSHFCDD